MTKLVVSSALVTSAESIVEQDVVALITKHAGSTYGDLAALLGAAIINVVNAKTGAGTPNSADASGQAVLITTNGAQTATDAAIETTVDLADAVAQATLTPKAAPAPLV